MGLLGALGMGFVKFAMMNFSGWNEIVFTFTPTPTDLSHGNRFWLCDGVGGWTVPSPARSAYHAGSSDERLTVALPDLSQTAQLLP